MRVVLFLDLYWSIPKRENNVEMKARPAKTPKDFLPIPTAETSDVYSVGILAGH